jgi:branched-chain amino acid aminotransferase
VGKRDLRGIVAGTKAGVNARGRANCGITYRILDRQTGRQFEFDGALEDFRPELMQKLLIPQARDLVFVAPPVLEEAAAVVNGLFAQHPRLINSDSCSYRLRPYEEEPVSFEGLKFTCNPTDVMLYLVLKPGELTPSIDSALYEYGDFIISPNAQVLHYCTEEFDGAKGVMGVDGKFALFRPEWGVDREIVSAQRLCLPVPPREFLLNARIRVALANKRRWPKTIDEGILYLRFFMFDSGRILGVDVTGEATIVGLAHPAGGYYNPGQNPVDAPISLWASTTYHRSAPGITGYIKAGANYAPTIKAKHAAKERGHAEVFYLDPTNRFANEIGSANAIGIKRLPGGKIKLFTPAFSADPAVGTILGGGTRDAVLTIAREDLGWEVEEGEIEIERFFEADGVIATGTAAVISAVNQIEHEGNGRIYRFNDFEPARILYDRVTGIQTGRYPDTRGWRYIIG